MASPEVRTSQLVSIMSIMHSKNLRQDKWSNQISAETPLGSRLETLCDVFHKFHSVSCVNLLPLFAYQLGCTVCPIACITNADLQSIASPMYVSSPTFGTDSYTLQTCGWVVVWIKCTMPWISQKSWSFFSCLILFRCGLTQICWTSFLSPCFWNINEVLHVLKWLLGNLWCLNIHVCAHASQGLYGSYVDVLCFLVCPLMSICTDLGKGHRFCNAL